MFNIVKKTFAYGAHQVTLETGEIARQSGAAILVSMDDTVVLDGAKVTLPEEKQAKLKANGAAAGPITLGVRPEHLILSGDESSMIHGTVDVSEMMGSAVHLHVSACGSDTIMIVPTTELESTSAFTIGSPIAFTFNGVMAHLFDRNTQKNLEV